MSAQPLYVVLHHEILSRGGQHYADEMVFHVASSREAALAYIKMKQVAPYSWWELQTTFLDNPAWPEHEGWYGLRGGRLKKPPFDKAVTAFKKHEKKEREKK